MIRVVTYNPLQEVLSADLNLWQDVTVSSRFALMSGGVVNDFGVTIMGADALFFQTGDPGVPTNDLVTLDDVVDWRDRTIVSGKIVFPAVNQLVGDSDDWQLNNAWTGPYVSHLGGEYTGTGAYSNLTSGAAVGSGAPPLNGAGVFRSYSVLLSAHLSASASAEVGPWLFCDPDTGALRLFQNSGSSVRMIGHIVFSAATARRP